MSMYDVIIGFKGVNFALLPLVKLCLWYIIVATFFNFDIIFYILFVFQSDLCMVWESS